MENGEASGDGSEQAAAESGPNPIPHSIPPNPSGDGPTPSEAPPPPPSPPSRTPFTSLSQVDADLALARALQEQERAYAMLRMNAVDGSDYESSYAGSYDYEVEEDGMGVGDEPDHAIEEDGGSTEGSDYEEDAFDANAPDVDLAEFENDEEFARALQDAEEREVAVRLMALAGLNEWASDDHVDHGSNSHDAWQEVDPDEYSYEELVALGDVVGTESRGLSSDTIASLPSVNYKAENVQADSAEQCVICRLEYEDGDRLVVLGCKHTYHFECINKWLQINKEEHHLSSLQQATEKLQVVFENVRSELRFEIDKVAAGQRLDLNLERGRIRDDLAKQNAETNLLNTKLEREIHAVKAQLEAAKYDLIKYCIGVLVSLSAVGLAFVRILM